METNDIADELAIRKLLEKFSIACMRADVASWGDTWAEDATWKIDKLDSPAQGREKIVAVFAGILPNIKFVSMQAFPADLVIEGDTARGKAYSQELIFTPDDGQKILVGCSHDTYIKRDGSWYFLSRNFETLYRGAMA